MSPCFKALQRGCLRIYTLIGLVFLTLFSTLLTACSSNLPEGSTVPKLEVQKVTFYNQKNNIPYFVIDYVLTHNSAQALPLLGLSADIYLNGTHAASFDQNLIGEENLIAPNEPIVRQFQVPANLLSQASIDSLNNNSLLVLNGTCALHAIFTHSDSLQAFNPSDSYAGLIHGQRSNTLNNLEQISARSELTPQASLTPIKRPEPEKPEQEKQDQQASATANNQGTATPNANTPAANTAPANGVAPANTAPANANSVAAPASTATPAVNPAAKANGAQTPNAQPAINNTQQANKAVVAPAQNTAPAPQATPVPKNAANNAIYQGEVYGNNPDLLQEFETFGPIQQPVSTPAPQQPMPQPVTAPAQQVPQVQQAPQVQTQQPAPRIEQVQPVQPVQSAVPTQPTQEAIAPQAQFNQQLTPEQSLSSQVPSSAQQVSRPASSNPNLNSNAQGVANQ